MKPGLQVQIAGRRLTLDIVCLTCGGEGGSDDGAGEFALCDSCDGVGYLKTEVGQVLHDFIVRHVKPDDLGV